MCADNLQINSLVLYKTRPARVMSIAEKIEIELGPKSSKKVRAKDIHLLHPGPFTDLKSLNNEMVDVSEAWELLEGESTSFSDLMELVFENPSPQEVWSLWQVIADGLYFEGTIDELRPRSMEQIEVDLRIREERKAAEDAWNGLLKRLTNKCIDPEKDAIQLAEVEQVAHGLIQRSRILDAFTISPTPENAHRFLIDVGFWQPDHNPYPRRQGVMISSPEFDLPPMMDENRADFTQHTAYAIDDEQSDDPDDALTLEGNRLWVHVADVASLVKADTDVDLEARSRGANLYLPEVISHMLPQALTAHLGLGLQEISPALSIGFCLDADAKPVDIVIQPTKIRATRISYSKANERMMEEPFSSMKVMMDRFRARRLSAGAKVLDLPEVSVSVCDGVPSIRPIRSRNTLNGCSRSFSRIPAWPTKNFINPLPIRA
jgi:exoribonuclease-2